MHSKTFIGMIFLAALIGCGEQDTILPGERETLDGQVLSAGETSAAETIAFAAPEPSATTNWTHRNGNARHALENPALPAALSQAWDLNIGAGNGRRQRITADPVVAEGRVFVMDADAMVTAVSTDGTPLWSRDLTPTSERSREIPGGALAIGGGFVFVTDGFGRVSALAADSGDVAWEQDLGAIGGAPTYSRGILYVAARNGIGWAINAETGRVLWTLSVAPSPSNLLSGPGPAISDRFALFPFASGEVVATFREGGFRRWSASVSGTRPGRAYARISDITGDPVIVGNRVYVGNQSGNVLALTLDGGKRLWTSEEGAYSPVWVAGGSVFLISDLGELVRLNADTGARLWGVELPLFTTERAQRRKGVYAHYGPVLAGGLLRVASSDGQLRSFDPASGSLVASVPLPGGAASNPIVVGETLYVVTGNGQLLAFR